MVRSQCLEKSLSPAPRCLYIPPNLYATPELLQILDAYQIPYRSTGSMPQMEVILYPPKQLTPWKPIAAILGILGLLYWLSKKNN